jgi:hypothetical protein
MAFINHRAIRYEGADFLRTLIRAIRMALTLALMTLCQGSLLVLTGQTLVHASGDDHSNGRADSQGPNGNCFVDGKLFARTADGINAALAVCSPGTTHLTGGSYDNLTSSIHIACGQSLIFEGNPALSFALPGTTPAFVFNSSQCSTYQNGVSGSAVINMQHTGGTVFKLCVGGHLGGVFGPSDGAINVANQTGNTIDLGPCSMAYSVANFTVQNITSQTVPGDLIQLITNNDTGAQGPSPYIETVTFSHIAAIDVTGRVIRINANATGPEANVNGVLFEHIFATNSLHADSPPSPIYIQSSFTTENSISFQVRDSVIGFPFATGAVTLVDSDGKPHTNHSILSVVLEGVDAQGGTIPSVPFSPKLTADVASTSDLEYRGATNAISVRPVYSQAFASTSTTPASAGLLRLAPSDAICWRNNSNSADLCMHKTNSDEFTMPGPLFKIDLVTPSIGGGSAINIVYRVSEAPLNSPFTSIAAQTCQQQKLTVKGAEAAGVAVVSPAGDLGRTNLSWSAFVSEPNMVAVRVCNPSADAVTPAAVKWNAVVIQ